MKKDMLINKISSNEITCAIVRGGKFFTSIEHGIKPILRWLSGDPTAFKGYDCCDKIVGKAAALLFACGQARFVYGEVMSRGAVKVLQDNGIAFSCNMLVDYVSNREKTGMCPMEEAVENISDPKEALVALRQKVEELSR